MAALQFQSTLPHFSKLYKSNNPSFQSCGPQQQIDVLNGCPISQFIADAYGQYSLQNPEKPTIVDFLGSSQYYSAKANRDEWIAAQQHLVTYTRAISKPIKKNIFEPENDSINETIFEKRFAEFAMQSVLQWNTQRILEYTKEIANFFRTHISNKAPHELENNGFAHQLDVFFVPHLLDKVNSDYFEKQKINRFVFGRTYESIYGFLRRVYDITELGKGNSKRYIMLIMSKDIYDISADQICVFEPSENNKLPPYPEYLYNETQLICNTKQALPGISWDELNAVCVSFHENSQAERVYFSTMLSNDSYYNTRLSQDNIIDVLQPFCINGNITEYFDQKCHFVFNDTEYTKFLKKYFPHICEPRHGTYSNECNDTCHVSDNDHREVLNGLDTKSQKPLDGCLRINKLIAEYYASSEMEIEYKHKFIHYIYRQKLDDTCLENSLRSEIDPQHCELVYFDPHFHVYPQFSINDKNQLQEYIFYFLQYCYSKDEIPTAKHFAQKMGGLENIITVFGDDNTQSNNTDSQQRNSSSKKSEAQNSNNHNNPGDDPGDESKSNNDSNDDPNETPTNKQTQINKTKKKGEIFISFKCKTFILNTIAEDFSTEAQIGGYMYKLHSLQIGAGEIESDNGMIKIVNYDFHEAKTNENLYCVAKPTKARNYKWKLEKRLCLAQDLLREYNISSDQIPQTLRSTFTSKLSKAGSNDSVFDDEKTFCNRIRKIKWQKVPVFAKTHNTLMTIVSKERFIKAIIKCIQDKTANDYKLIPILMFDEKNECCIEHIWPLKLKNLDINILISLEPNRRNQNGKIEVKGIHLDKNSILTQHKVVSASHECHCLDDFEINISNLNISPNHIDEQYHNNPFEAFVQELLPTLSPQFKTKALKLLKKNKNNHRKTYDPTPTVTASDITNSELNNHSTLEITDNVTVSHLSPMQVKNSTENSKLKLTNVGMPQNNISTIQSIPITTPGLNALPYYYMPTFIPPLSTTAGGGLLSPLNISMYTKYYPPFNINCLPIPVVNNIYIPSPVFYSPFILANAHVQ